MSASSPPRAEAPAAPVAQEVATSSGPPPGIVRVPANAYEEDEYSDEGEEEYGEEEEYEGEEEYEEEDDEGPSTAQSGIAIGVRVRVHSMKIRTDLNDRCGTVLAWQASEGKWRVSFEDLNANIASDKLVTEAAYHKARGTVAPPPKVIDWKKTGQRR